MLTIDHYTFKPFFDSDSEIMGHIYCNGEAALVVLHKDFTDLDEFKALYYGLSHYCRVFKHNTASTLKQLFPDKVEVIDAFLLQLAKQKLVTC